MAKKQSDKVRPVEEIRIGNIKAALWRNEGEKGAWFNLTLQRLYRDAEGQWYSTASFGRDDLLVLAKLANAAHTRILQLTAEQRPAKSAAA
ncbi:MAG TPA: hypothetical protein VGN12_19400 [Pirellulales bacterium]|jgi:hypothetical protein